MKNLRLNVGNEEFNLFYQIYISGKKKMSKCVANVNC